ncbi:hypothetical protein, partial [Phytopseudomonas dryadis]|uniref:hypothetical protein n=1 Tax=Phytopseudomonas dryadis TaxID=2487520 RepID=UPI001A9560E7
MEDPLATKNEARIVAASRGRNASERTTRAGMLERQWLEAGGWRLEAGGWRLEAGGWRLEAGGWRLEAGGWRLEAGGW